MIQVSLSPKSGARTKGRTHSGELRGGSLRLRWRWQEGATEASTKQFYAPLSSPSSLWDFRLYIQAPNTKGLNRNFTGIIKS